MTEWYTIEDLDRFVESTRILVYDLFGSQSETNLLDPKHMSDLTDEEKIELDTVLSQQESLNIIQSLAKKQVNKTTQTIRYIISDKSFYSAIESLNSRMVSNMLHNLSNKGLLEIAFDSEINDFVFWPKDENNNQKTETD